MFTEWINEYISQLSNQRNRFSCGVHRKGWLVRSLTGASFLGWLQYRPPRTTEQSAMMDQWDPLQTDDSVIFLDELMALPLPFKINVNFICQKSSLPQNWWFLPLSLRFMKLWTHWSPVALLEFWVWQIWKSADYLTVEHNCSVFRFGFLFCFVFLRRHLTLLRLSVPCLPTSGLQSEPPLGRRVVVLFLCFWSSVVVQLSLDRVVSEIQIHVTCLTGCSSTDSSCRELWVVFLSAFHWCQLLFNSPVPQLGEHVHQLSRVVRSQR